MISPSHGNGIIMLNPDIRGCWMRKDAGFQPRAYAGTVPEGAGPGRVSGPTMDEFKNRKARACVDKLICTRLADGQPAVLYGFRDGDQPFGGKWWMQGGQLGAYEDILAFAASRGKAECGVAAPAEVCIGVFYTSSFDHPTSTVQPCYASFVPHDDIVRFMQADENHSKGLRLITLAELDAVTEGQLNDPASPWHWYPIEVGGWALSCMPE